MRKNNKKAVVFDGRPENATGPILRSIIKAAKEDGYDVISANEDAWQYEYVIIFKNKIHTIPKLKTAAKVGWWMCDLRPPYEMQSPKQRIDTVFVCNTQFQGGYEKYFGVPTYYMPQCGIDENMAEALGTKITWDALFIGSIATTRFHHNRYPIIQGINDQGFEVKIISGQKFTPDSKYLYRKTPFSLSISPEAVGYTSNRTYNILSAGGFCLTKYFEGIEYLFENHKHLVWFNTPEEACDIMRYYYEHEDEYIKIRENGKALYEQKHTARHRLRNMFSILEGTNTSFDGWL